MECLDGDIVRRDPGPGADIPLGVTSPSLKIRVLSRRVPKTVEFKNSILIVKAPPDDLSKFRKKNVLVKSKISFIVNKY